MKKVSKKSWGLVFALALVLTMIPLSAFAAEYDIWVGETQITDDNKGDVLGDGTVSYDTKEKVLTLNNANIESTEWYGINSSNDLTIELKGENFISLPDDPTHKYGIIMWNESSEQSQSLLFKGEGNLYIYTGESEKGAHIGILGNDITVDSKGYIGVITGKGEESRAAFLHGRYKQNSGEVSFSAGESNTSYGIEADLIDLNKDAKFYTSGYSKALTSVPKVKVSNPSIIAAEDVFARFDVQKIDSNNITKLTGDNPTYKAVSVIPSSKLKQDLKVDVLPIEGASVMVRKLGDEEFKNSLKDLKEDDIIEVKVDVTDSKKELDVVIVTDEDEDGQEQEEKIVGSVFVMWRRNVKIKAVSATPADEVRLMIASTKMEKGEESVVMDAAPFIKNGRTMVPLRYIGEALGLKVNWDAKTKTVTLSNESQEIVVPTNTLSMKANGKTVQSDVLPVLQGGRVYLSISNIGKALGLEQGKEIRWDAKSKTVVISMENN